MKVHRVFAVFLAITVSGCDKQSDADISVADIAKSVKFEEEEAAQMSPPYGLSLYPEAKVTLSMLDGMSLNIETEADRDLLGQFYSEELSKKGYVIESSETKEGKLTLNGRSKDNVNNKLVITIVPNDNSPNEFTLVFLKFLPGG